MQTAKHDNVCGHSAEEYLGSVEVIENDKLIHYDIYLHDGGKICARYGDEPHEYLSLSDAWTVLATAGDKLGIYCVYAQIRDLLRDTCKIVLSARRCPICEQKAHDGSCAGDDNPSVEMPDEWATEDPNT